MSDLRICTKLDTQYPRLVRLPNPWRIRTPSGHFVPGILAKTARGVWGPYCRVMGKSREELEGAGYRAVNLARLLNVSNDKKSS